MRPAAVYLVVRSIRAGIIAAPPGPCVQHQGCERASGNRPRVGILVILYPAILTASEDVVNVRVVYEDVACKHAPVGIMHCQAVGPHGILIVDSVKNEGAVLYNDVKCLAGDFQAGAAQGILGDAVGECAIRAGHPDVLAVRVASAPAIRARRRRSPSRLIAVNDYVIQDHPRTRNP